MSPRASGGEDSREGDEEEEEEEDQDLDRTFQPGDVMKLQLEVLEGELGMRLKLDRLALLVADPLQWNYTTTQICPFTTYPYTSQTDLIP